MAAECELFACGIMSRWDYVIAFDNECLDVEVVVGIVIGRYCRERDFCGFCFTRLRIEPIEGAFGNGIAIAEKLPM